MAKNTLEATAIAKAWFISIIHTTFFHLFLFFDFVLLYLCISCFDHLASKNLKQHLRNVEKAFRLNGASYRKFLVEEFRGVNGVKRIRKRLTFLCEKTSDVR